MTAYSPVALNKDTAESAPPIRWQSATWEDYCQLRDELATDDAHWQLHFDKNALLAFDMGWEGINHAIIRELIAMLFFAWLRKHPNQPFTSIGQCLLEKSPTKAGAPDLVVYLGDNHPRWSPGESRAVDLHRWPVPRLIGEVSDTTLATDLDEKKRTYASLGIQEYWVVDVRGHRVFIFQLDEDGCYQSCDASDALPGISTELLEATIDKALSETNGQAALWFEQQLLAANVTEKESDKS